MKFKPYPSYKDSGIEWLGKVPVHWKVKRIKYISTCNDDLIAESTAPNYEIEYVEISGITENFGITETTTITFSEAPSRAKRRVKHGDIIISTVRTYLRAISSINYPPENMVVSTGFAVIRPRNVNSGFIGYLFHAEFLIANVIAHSAGISYPAINASELIKLQVPFPSIQEQATIASFLDRETQRIDTLVEEKNHFIGLLKEKRLALISHVVTKGLDSTVKMKDSGVEWLGKVPEHWKVVQLKRVVNSVKTGGTPSNLNESHIEDSGFDWFTPGDFDENLYLNNSNRKLSKIGKSEVKIFAPQTIMMIGIGATIGKVSISKYESSCNQQINAITCSKYILPCYCAYYLKANRDYIVNLYGKYTTLPIINQDDTKSIITALPSIQEQTAIANFLDNQTAKIDTLITETQQSIALLKEHRTALISAAVTGKIDVREVA